MSLLDAGSRGNRLDILVHNAAHVGSLAMTTEDSGTCYVVRLDDVRVAAALLRGRLFAFFAANMLSASVRHSRHFVRLFANCAEPNNSRVVLLTRLRA